MGVSSEEGYMKSKDCILHFLNDYIHQIEYGRNLKPEYSAGFYFKYLVQLRKFQHMVENMDFPDLFELDFFYKCLFYDTKFVIHICGNNKDRIPLELVIIETPLLSVSDFAKLYNVTEGAVRQWIRRGKITSAIKNGNEWSIPEICDMNPHMKESNEYHWDCDLTDPPDYMDYFDEYDALKISKDNNSDGFILYFYSRYKEVHDNLEIVVDTNVKEKVELWLIANPAVYSPGSLIDVIG